MLKKNSAFSMIGVIVSVAIITIGLIGIFTLMQKVLIASSTSGYRAIALNLAQECMEVVRNIRDTNWDPEFDSWDDGLDETTSGNVNYDSIAIDNLDDKLYIDTNYRYTHNSSGDASPFSRHIEISDVYDAESATTTKQVKCIVEWSERGRDHSVNMEERLYNWR